MIYPGLDDLFGHFSPGYLKQIASRMNGYTWFRFVEQESKSLIFKRMATRLLYRMLNRQPHENICAGNDNGYILGGRAVGLSSRGVNYKSVNEDGIGIFEREDELLLVVCDGVGDCLVGEVASFVILDQFIKTPEATIAQIFAESVEVLVNLGESLVHEIPEFVTFPNEVSQAAVTGVSVRGNECKIGQVGDVLFYLFRDDHLQLLDQNHHWLSLAQLKKLFADEHYLAQRHIIANAVGRNYDPYWEPVVLELKAGDMILVASDGLETLHPQELLETVNGEKDLPALLDTLYQRVIDASLKWNTVGSPIYTKPDNISMILYHHDP